MCETKTEVRPAYTRAPVGPLPNLAPVRTPCDIRVGQIRQARRIS